MKKILLFLGVAFLSTQLSAQNTEQFTQQFRAKVLRDGSFLRKKNKTSIEYDFTDHEHLKMTLNFITKEDPEARVKSITLRANDSYSRFLTVHFSQEKKIIKKRQIASIPSNANETTPTTHSNGGVSTTVNSDGTISTTHNSGAVSTTVNSDGTTSTTHNSGAISTTVNSDGATSTTHNSGAISTTVNSDGTTSTTHNSGGISTTVNPDGTISTAFHTPSTPPNQPSSSFSYETIEVEVSVNIITLELTKDIIEEILVSKSITLDLVLNNEELFLKFRRSQVKKLQRKIKATL